MKNSKPLAVALVAGSMVTALVIVILFAIGGRLSLADGTKIVILAMGAAVSLGMWLAGFFSGGSSSNLTRTAAFTCVAAYVCVAAFGFRQQHDRVVPFAQGDRLFPEFTDPTDAASFEIVRYDKTGNDLTTLKIARKAGAWTIASHNDYPANGADAEQRIRDTAVRLMNLEVLRLATDLTSEHVMYGVVEPEMDTITQNDEGVGTRLTVEDASGSRLIDLVVGMPVVNSPGQRYVRKPGQSRVYTAEINANDLSSDFHDWIDDALLQIRPDLIKQYQIKDYNVELRPGGDGQQPSLVPQSRFEMVTRYDPDNFRWDIRQFVESNGSEMQAVVLQDDEELNADSLYQLSRDINQVSILDVVSKPPSLSDELKTGAATITDPKSLLSLQQRGIYPISQDPIELVASNGELRIGLTNGVEVTLYFGGQAGIEESRDKAVRRRYLMATARAFVAKPTVPASDPPTPEEAAAYAEEQKEYEQRMKTAGQEAKKLNDRFADWYYVISEDDYRRLSLSRIALIRPRDNTEGFSIADFRRLERDGIDVNKRTIEPAPKPRDKDAPRYVP